jgi:hypothetical protein
MRATLFGGRFLLVGLLACLGTPALANDVTSASVALACTQYTLSASANFLATGTPYSIKYTFTLSSTTGGPPVTISNSFSFTYTGPNGGDFSDTVTNSAFAD